MNIQTEHTEAMLDAFVRSSIAIACDRRGTVVALDTSLDDLAIDSLRMIDIVSRVEQEFAVRFRMDQILDFFLARDVAELVQTIRKCCRDQEPDR